MPKQIKLLVFDWDGTLADSAAHIVYCVQQAAASLNMTVPEANSIKKGIGLGLLEAIGAVVPVSTSEERNALVQKYREIYIASWENQPHHPEKLFEGTREVLAHLKENYQLAIATGKSRKGLNRALKTYELLPFFIATRCADETASKPSPKMLYELLEETKVHPSEALMIGDTEYDLCMAKEAKVPALAVSYGTRTKEQLLTYQPDGCIDNIQELIPWLTTFRS